MLGGTNVVEGAAIPSSAAYRARLRAQLVAGCLPDELHGRSAGYNDAACRCDRCRAWEAARAARKYYDADRARLQHGTAATYRHYGCRCEQCTEAGHRRNQTRHPLRAKRSRRAVLPPPTA